MKKKKKGVVTDKKEEAETASEQLFSDVIARLPEEARPEQELGGKKKIFSKKGDFFTRYPCGAGGSF